MIFFLFLSAAVVTASSIIAYNGREASTYAVGGGFHQRPRIVLNTQDRDARLFDSLRSIALTTGKDTAGIMDAMRLVAQKAYDSADINKAHIALEALEKSLVYVADEKPVATSASEMRANMCLSRPENADCQEFMLKYCKTDAGKGSEACKKFDFPGHEEEKPQEQAAATEQGAATEEVGDAQGAQWTYDKDAEAVGDWRREYGSHGKDTYRSVCARHPDNDWCRIRYGDSIAGTVHGSSGNIALWLLICVCVAGAIAALVFFFQAPSKA